jgi:hypothetical protein
MWFANRVLLLTCVAAGSAFADQPMELGEAGYLESAGKEGVVLLEANWGRRWDCAGSDNAQLQELTFTRIADEASDSNVLKLKTPSRLFVDNRFSPYALLIEPGEYALTGFDVKIAWSMTDIVHAVWNAEKAGYAGTFTVAPGEFVYIGHFGLDCSSEPIPWRYYIEGADEFDHYIEGFRERFPFVGNVPVQFRLFETTLFGTEYSLLDSAE